MNKFDLKITKYTSYLFYLIPIFLINAIFIGFIFIVGLKDCINSAFCVGIQYPGFKVKETNLVNFEHSSYICMGSNAFVFWTIT